MTRFFSWLLILVFIVLWSHTPMSGTWSIYLFPFSHSNIQIYLPQDHSILVACLLTDCFLTRSGNESWSQRVSGDLFFCSAAVWLRGLGQFSSLCRDSISQMVKWKQLAIRFLIPVAPKFVDMKLAENSFFKQLSTCFFSFKCPSENNIQSANTSHISTALDDVYSYIL